MTNEDAYWATILLQGAFWAWVMAWITVCSAYAKDNWERRLLVLTALFVSVVFLAGVRLAIHVRDTA